MAHFGLPANSVGLICRCLSHSCHHFSTKNSINNGARHTPLREPCLILPHSLPPLDPRPGVGLRPASLFEVRKLKAGKASPS